jgi:hypothetical protein
MPNKHAMNLKLQERRRRMQGQRCFPGELLTMAISVITLYGSNIGQQRGNNAGQYRRGVGIGPEWVLG